MIDHTRNEQLNQALELLHFAFRAVIERPDEVLGRHGLGRVHHRILYFVGRNPGCSVGQLLAILRVSKQALHAPLGRLVRDGWIVAAPDSEDRRLRRLHLSDRGSSLEEDLSGDQRVRFARAFDATGPAAEAAWRAVMQSLAMPEEGPPGEQSPLSSDCVDGR